MQLPPDFKEFLKLLNENKVNYLLPVAVISLDDLKVNKKASGRHKDLDDLEHLP
jgi:hypothetical protein